MNELLNNTAIVGGALVKALVVLMPGESIERILDESRAINLKRVFNTLKAQKFSTVMNLVAAVEAAGLHGEEAVTLLTWFEDPEIQKLLDSGLLNSILNFISENKPSTQQVSCWPCLRPPLK
jgi:hypothetical protein